MNKILSHSDVISQLSDGMTIGVGGWGARRKPMSLIRAICQSDLKDLTIVSYGGPDVGLLCAHRKVKKLIFGFVSLDMIPLDSHFISDLAQIFKLFSSALQIQTQLRLENSKEGSSLCAYCIGTYSTYLPEKLE